MESAVTVHLDGLVLPFITVAANSASPGCPQIAPGNHVVSFQGNGQLLDEFLTRYENNETYAVVLTNVGTTYRAFGVTSDQSVDAGSNGLTLVNATATAGDVYVTAASEDPSAQTRVASSLAPTASTTVAPAFVVTPSSNLRVRLFDVGSTTNARSDITLVPLLESRQGVVVFIDRVVGTDPGAFQVDPCE